MPPARTPLSLALVLAALGACGDGGGGSSLAMDDLRDAGSACPVDLEGAVADSGLEASGDVEVTVTEGSGEGGMDASAIDRMGGVHVECSVAVGDDSVTAELVASPEPGAVGLFLPLVQQALEVPSGELEGVADRAAGTDVGELVDLGAEGPVALARLDVGDAESAAVVVSGGDVASAGQTRAVAEDLLGDL